eukprot:scaffold3586_cov404-Prasinococcus_capsulatus_cf.AAC.10
MQGGGEAAMPFSNSLRASARQVYSRSSRQAEDDPRPSRLARSPFERRAAADGGPVRRGGHAQGLPP